MSESDTDLAEVLAQFTNLIMNERVKSYNEGLDAANERNARLVAALKEARQFIHLTYPGCENERRVDAAIDEALAQQSTEKS